MASSLTCICRTMMNILNTSKRNNFLMNKYSIDIFEFLPSNSCGHRGMDGFHYQSDQTYNNAFCA